MMHEPDMKEEAENCRRKALAYLGKPEASFLLRVGRAFDKLSEKQSHRNSR